MNTNRFLIAAAAGIIGLVNATAVRADSVVAVAISNLTFVGFNNLCGTSGFAPCIETLNISFDWNAATGSIQPGTISNLASGDLGGPAEFESTGPVVGGQVFLWVGSFFDQAVIDTCGFDCGKFPSVGSYDTADIGILCVSNACSDDGFDGAQPSLSLIHI